VLFADVVGSMALAAKLDAERLREIMHELFNRCAAVVQRYHGTVDKFTGDGLMALFGAPAALEDHALRACICALEMQTAVSSLAEEVLKRDRVDLALRIGLNSGDVVAGDIGSSGYTVIGHHVGMAQRMETAADPGGIMCSTSTANLVQAAAVLGPTEWIRIKGHDEPVPGRRLERVDLDRALLGRDDGPLIGRDDDIATLIDVFYRGQTTIAAIVGEPGLGKSRAIREFAGRINADGRRVVIARCESHTAEVPLRVISRLLRAMLDIDGLDDNAARARIHAQLHDVARSDAETLGNTVVDFLGLQEPNTPPRVMDPDAQHNKLIDVIATVAANCPVPLALIIEDLHWIDAASEEVLVRFADTLDAQRTLFVGTFRPEYRGSLREQSGITIMLAPLANANAIALASALLGPHPTARGVANRIAESAAGIPFFIEEIVRDLLGRGVLVGNRGDYRVVVDISTIAVPATVHAVIAARIDRLPASAKTLLNAASVIGSAFDRGVLDELVRGAKTDDLGELVSTELLDQVRFLPEPRYVFRHPLVRAVSYGSQLSATRAAYHRRLADILATGDRQAAEKNSALVAHHAEAAGDFDMAYSWYMRSADWLKHRDIRGARDSWERARGAADRLSSGVAETTAKRVAPRAQLTATTWHVAITADVDRCFAELRELTRELGDELHLALGIAGRVIALIEGRFAQPQEAAALVRELTALFDRIEGTASERAEILTAIALAQYGRGELTAARDTLNRLPDVSDGVSAAILALPKTMAGIVKIFSGLRDGGQHDLREGLRLAKESDPLALARAIGYRVDLIVEGFDDVDDELLADTAKLLQLAESFGNRYALGLARWARGSVLLRSTPERADAGLDLLRLSSSDEVGFFSSVVDADLAMWCTNQAERDERIAALAASVRADMEDEERLLVGHSVGVLVRLLLERAGPGDRALAREFVAAYEAPFGPETSPAFWLWSLQCRALLAASGDGEGDYAQIVDEYRKLAERLDARGHLAVAIELADRPLVGQGGGI
jgi:adenylate cyclase